MNQTHSRRDLLLAGSAAGIAATGVASAVPRDPVAANATVAAFPGGREVIGGSPYPTFSRAVKLDKVVWVAGVLGQKPGTRDLVSTDFEPQARQALENLKASVEASGSRLELVLKCGVFLTEASDFAAFNKVYVEYFPKHPPARSTVIVKELVAPGARVEIDCVTCVE